jgi:hypothetical protein
MSDWTLRQIQGDQRRIGQTEVRETPFYQEGTFQPSLMGAGTAGTFAYSAGARSVNWTRIGNRVKFNGRIQITAITVAPTGAMSITGFPATLTAANTGFGAPGGADFGFWTLNLPAGYTQVAGQFTDGATSFLLIRSGDNVAPTNVDGTEIALVGGVADFRFKGEYQI